MPYKEPQFVLEKPRSASSKNGMTTKKITKLLYVVIRALVRLY